MEVACAGSKLLYQDLLDMPDIRLGLPAIPLTLPPMPDPPDPNVDMRSCEEGAGQQQRSPTPKIFPDQQADATGCQYYSSLVAPGDPWQDSAEPNRHRARRRLCG